MKIVRATFWKMKFLIFFLYELPLILRVDRKRKNGLQIFAGGILDIDFERDWPIGLGATLGAYIKLKSIFVATRIFPGKADSAIFLGLECTINPQNLMEIVRAFSERMIFFFLCELLLNFTVDLK